MSLNFTHKNVIVYGLGVNGRAVATALADNRANVQIFDDRQEEKLESTPEGFQLLQRTSVYFREPSVQDLENCHAFFKAPGISGDADLVKKARNLGVPIMGDVDLLYRREKGAKFIGITGTNGKSTTTALAGHILTHAGQSVAVGGNLGVPCMSLETGKDFYVLELSSYQLEIMQEAVMDRAVVVNITPDHLERHATLENYTGVKMNIFARQNSADHIAISGVDNAELENVNLLIPHVKTISAQEKKADYFVTKTGILKDTAENVCIDLKQFTHLPGVHNWQNIVATYGLLKGLVSVDAFVEGVRSFKNLPHRMEKIMEVDGISFYNDSKATNPESAICALGSFDHIYWVVGGLEKDGGITPCLDYVDDVKGAFVIGEKTLEMCEEIGEAVTAFPCHNLEDAVWMAWREARRSGNEKSVILLSPACASWDQFTSFEHRGDVFTSTVYDILRQEKRDDVLSE